MKTSLDHIIGKAIKYGNEHNKSVSVNTIGTSLGQNHNIKNIPPIPKIRVSPWSENKLQSDDFKCNKIK